MKKLLKYDFFYLFKTSKFIVFAAVFVLFSVTSPLTAKYINQILGFLVGADGFGFDFPDPTVYLAYEQYISDLYEVVFLVTIFVAISIFIRDKNKGLLPLIFSKPINRSKYILSKYISFLVLIFVSLLIGYLFYSYYTYFLFDEVFFGIGTYMMLLYFLEVALVASIALFSATYMKSYLLATVSTYGIYIFYSILAIFDTVPILKHFPGLIKKNISYILYEMSEPKDIIFNILITLVFIAMFLFLSIDKMRKSDI